MADATAKIPGRVLIQVRDGVPNVAAEFEIEVRVDGTRALGPNEAGAKLAHDVNVSSLVTGLYGAIIPLSKEYIDGQSTPEKKAKAAAWLREMSEWALAQAEA